MFEHAAEGIVITDEQGNLFQCNAAYCALTGYYADELAQRHYPSLIHPDDRADNLALIQQLVEGLRLSFTKSGVPILVHKRVSIVRDGWNNLKNHLYFVELVMDVSERRRIEHALWENEAFVSDVLDSLSAHVCVLDPGGIIIRTNKPWKQLAGKMGSRR